MASDTTIEIFTELAVAWSVIAFRIFARIRQLGIGKLQVDDYLMLLAGCLYAGEVTSAYYSGTQKVLILKEASWIFLSGWLTYVSLLWTLKTCILIFYFRLTENVHINNMKLRIRICAVTLAVTYISIICVVLLVCSPLQKQWQAGPLPGSQCHTSTANSNTYVLLVCNILTDIYLICIPIPVIWTARLGLKRKLGLTALFAGAIVTAVFGMLRCIVIITSSSMDSASVAGHWSARESCTAVIVTNLPLIYPYLNQMVHSLRRKVTTVKGSALSSSRDQAYGNASTGGDVSHASIGSKNVRNKKPRSPYAIPGDTVIDRNESEELIINHATNHSTNHAKSDDIELRSHKRQSMDRENHGDLDRFGHQSNRKSGW